MYKLTDYDKFQIKNLFSKISKIAKSSDKNFNIENIYTQSNAQIAEVINTALEFWYDVVTS